MIIPAPSSLLHLSQDRRYFCESNFLLVAPGRWFELLRVDGSSSLGSVLPPASTNPDPAEGSSSRSSLPTVTYDSEHSNLAEPGPFARTLSPPCLGEPSVPVFAGTSATFALTVNKNRSDTVPRGDRSNRPRNRGNRQQTTVQRDAPHTLAFANRETSLTGGAEE